MLHEQFVEFSRLRWWRGSVERGPLAAPNVAEQGELRNHQHASANLLNASVHFSLVVFKHAQSRNFFRQVDGIGLAVVPADAKQNQQTRANFTGNLSIHRDFGPAHPLHDSTHVCLTVTSGHV